jgi:hypothetical protein
MTPGLWHAGLDPPPKVRQRSGERMIGHGWRRVGRGQHHIQQGSKTLGSLPDVALVDLVIEDEELGQPVCYNLLLLRRRGAAVDPRGRLSKKRHRSTSVVPSVASI